MKRNLKSAVIRFVIFVALLLFLWYFSTFTVTVSHTEIKSDKINGNLKIVQITDLHGAEFSRRNESLIKQIEKESPDLVFATGDMYTNSDQKGRDTAEQLLVTLAEKFPVYYVTGEHDNDDDFHLFLKNNGVRVLNYKSETVKIRDDEIVIYGIDNVYYSPTFDLFNEFSPDYNKYNILLAHINNAYAFKGFGADLTICGDTHGGQIRLPFVGAVYMDGIWFPEWSDKKQIAYVKGLYSLGENKLFVSGGLGSRPYPIRLFNRPEISVITLKSSTK